MNIYAMLVGEGAPESLVLLAAKPSLGEIITIHDEETFHARSKFRVIGPIAHKAFLHKAIPRTLASSLVIPVERIYPD